MKKKLTRILIAFLIIILLILIVALIDPNYVAPYIPGNHIPLKAYRPTHCPGTQWVSEDPNISFQVPDEQSCYWEIDGVLKLDGKEMKITMTFNPGVYVQVYDQTNNSGRIFNGRCRFYSDKMVIEIDEDMIFDGQYKTVTFYKQDQIASRT